jgi:proteic killer suppression protein
MKRFADKHTLALYEDGICHPRWRAFEAIAVRKLDRVMNITRLDDLRVPPGNRLEPLKGDRAGQWSIRINDQYRICFSWDGTQAHAIEITDYH